MIGGTKLKLDIRAATTILANTKGSIITTGVGKSGHIAIKVSSSLASCAIPSFYLHPTEALHGDLGRIRADDAILAFSHSGASVELETIILHSQWLDIPIVSVTSDAGSRLSLASRAAIAYPVVDEAFARAPSTSTTQQIVIGDMLTVAIAECRGITPEDFLRNHPGGAIGRGTDGG